MLDLSRNLKECAPNYMTRRRAVRPRVGEMTEMRKLVCSATFALIALTAGQASAESLDKDGTDFIISAERLFGVNVYANDLGGPASIGFNLLWRPTVTNPYAVPRVGFDAAVYKGLTVGGVLGFSFQADPDVSGFNLYPRVGYIFDIAEDWALWPRGGLEFLFVDFGGPSLTQLALGLEGQAVWMPLENVGFTAGPSFDIGLVGGSPVPGADNLNQFNFGIDFGLLVHW